MEASKVMSSGDGRPGAAVRMVDRKPPRRAGRTLRRQWWLPYLLVSPLVAAIGVLTAYPTLVTTTQAFFSVDPLYTYRFAGLGNFRALLSDPDVTASLYNTLLYCAFGVVLSTVLGVAIAYAIRSRFAGRGVMLAVIVLPWAVPSVVGGVVWQWIYDPTFGVLNGFLVSTHMLGSYVIWFGVHRLLSVLVIEISQVWQITPLTVLIVLAALQTVPNDLSEASVVDGCSSLQRFRYVTLPLLRPAIAVGAVQACVLSLNIFDQVYVMVRQDTAGVSAMMQTYVVAFSDMNFGEGYALSLIVVVLTAFVTMLLLLLIYRRVTY